MVNAFLRIETKVFVQFTSFVLRDRAPWTSVTRFGKFLDTLAIFYEGYKVSSKMLNLLWQISYAVGQFLFIVNDQIFQN